MNNGEMRTLEKTLHQPAVEQRLTKTKHMRKYAYTSDMYVRILNVGTSCMA